ncbi:MAG: hypothetical protein RBS57_18860, partial [Desulforhabdus sp.]|nr:hypothetical protein [Desulforhabdus sp.]
MAMFLPVEVRLFRRMISRWTTRSISYGSILHADHPPGVEGVISILDSYKNWARKRHLFTELRNVVDLNDLQPVLNKLGFHYEDHLNYLINLNCTADEVFQNIGRRTRKHIRKALRENEVSIMEV